MGHEKGLTSPSLPLRGCGAALGAIRLHQGTFLRYRRCLLPGMAGLLDARYSGDRRRPLASITPECCPGITDPGLSKHGGLSHVFVVAGVL